MFLQRQSSLDSDTAAKFACEYMKVAKCKSSATRFYDWCPSEPRLEECDADLVTNDDYGCPWGEKNVEQWSNAVLSCVTEEAKPSVYTTAKQANKKILNPEFVSRVFDVYGKRFNN